MEMGWGRDDRGRDGMGEGVEMGLGEGVMGWGLRVSGWVSGGEREEQKIDDAIGTPTLENRSGGWFGVFKGTPGRDAVMMAMTRDPPRSSRRPIQFASALTHGLHGQDSFIFHSVRSLIHSPHVVNSFSTSFIVTYSFACLLISSLSHSLILSFN